MDNSMLDVLLINALKPPCITFADKNYDSQGGGHEYVSALYNPLTGKVEMWDTLVRENDIIPYWPSGSLYQTTSWEPDFNPAYHPPPESYKEVEALANQ